MRFKFKMVKVATYEYLVKMGASLPLDFVPVIIMYQYNEVMKSENFK